MGRLAMRHRGRLTRILYATGGAIAVVVVSLCVLAWYTCNRLHGRIAFRNGVCVTDSGYEYIMVLEPAVLVSVLVLGALLCGLLYIALSPARRIQ